MKTSGKYPLFPDQQALEHPDGGDVLGALVSGIRQVDAVEIDSVVIQVSQRSSAAARNADPSVTVHVDDARVSLSQEPPILMNDPRSHLPLTPELIFLRGVELRGCIL